MENGHDRVVEGLRAIRHNLFEMLSAQRNAATLMREVTPAGSRCHPLLRSIERRCNELIARGRASLSESGMLGSHLLHPLPPSRETRAWAGGMAVEDLVAELVQHLSTSSALLLESWRRLEREHAHELTPNLLRLCHVVQEESGGFLGLLAGLEQRLLSLATHPAPPQPQAKRQD